LDYHGRPQTLDPAESNGPLAGLLAHRARLPDTVLEWIKNRVRILNSGALETRIAPFCHREGNRLWEFSIHRDLQQGSYRLMIVPGTATPDPLTTLSQREIEVLEWVEKGKTNEQISEILGLSQNTVKTFLKRAFIKLGVENRRRLRNAPPWRWVQHSITPPRRDSAPRKPGGMTSVSSDFPRAPARPCQSIPPPQNHRPRPGNGAPRLNLGSATASRPYQLERRIRAQRAPGAAAPLEK
jgi:DNA-binding CsgD family transcriptional regulator